MFLMIWSLFLFAALTFSVAQMYQLWTHTELLTDTSNIEHRQKCKLGIFLNSILLYAWRMLTCTRTFATISYYMYHSVSTLQQSSNILIPQQVQFCYVTAWEDCDCEDTKEILFWSYTSYELSIPPSVCKNTSITYTIKNPRVGTVIVIN